MPSKTQAVSLMAGREMLLESDVIEAACRELERRGYIIGQRLQAHEHGCDIIAHKHQGVRSTLMIEAKGETSSRAGSGRHGHAFDSRQVTSHVARAVYTALVHLSGSSEDIGAGLALPATEFHLRTVAAVRPMLERLGVVLFWVGADG